MTFDRRFVLRALGAGLGCMAAPAWAHHGWTSFRTDRACYLRGAATSVRWGNPHGEVVMRADETALPEGFRQRPLPPGADEEYGRATLASARPYEGGRPALTLVLAGPSWMSRWGLDRPLEEGEVIEALGFLAAEDADTLRPVMFWTGDGQGVWQQLTAFPTLPEPA
ncbi:DUF6152 family protein [Oceanicella sp. SM1341]|uniref:DUF6152 family protein n=1 Tax=Oceanicella sp. SM1341 TaxID=1548889 RepID=UPI000E51128B|nr:DUF6152 family protein [Oceanicella sp. SM1341]